MPTIYDLKPGFQSLLRPLTGGLARVGVSANQVTLAAVVLSCLTGALLVRHGSVPWLMLTVPAVLLARMALNAIDGMLAREHDQQSAPGVILNELGDVLSDVALYLPFAALPGVDGTGAVLFVVFALIAEFAGIVALAVGSRRRYDGPLGKSDRAFAVGLICLLLAAGITPGAWLNAVFVLLAVLSAVTAANRARQALREGDR